MRIRRARSSDVSAVNDIVQRAYGVYIGRIGRRPAPMDDDYDEKIARGQTYVADDGVVVGLIVLVVKPDHLLIENVAVDPQRRGEGMGRSLLGFAESYALECGTSSLRLYTHAAMTENLSLYRHLGYDEIARRTESGFQRVFLSKRL